MALAMEQVTRMRGSAIVMLMTVTRKTATQWEVVVAPVQQDKEKSDGKQWKEDAVKGIKVNTNCI